MKLPNRPSGSTIKLVLEIIKVVVEILDNLFS
jgi:hypothetical protein